MSQKFRLNVNITNRLPAFYFEYNFSVNIKKARHWKVLLIFSSNCRLVSNCGKSITTVIEKELNLNHLRNDFRAGNFHTFTKKSEVIISNNQSYARKLYEKYLVQQNLFTVF